MLSTTSLEYHDILKLSVGTGMISSGKGLYSLRHTNIGLSLCVNPCAAVQTATASDSHTPEQLSF